METKRGRAKLRRLAFGETRLGNKQAEADVGEDAVGDDDDDDDEDQEVDDVDDVDDVEDADDVRVWLLLLVWSLLWCLSFSE